MADEGDCCNICNMESGVDWHHEIPRSYGGENGPQTPLCSGHHTLVHNLALTLYRVRDENVLVIPRDVPKAKVKEVLRLVRTIVIARKAYEKAKKEGKAPRRGSSIQLDSKRMQRVDVLTRLMGCSQVSVVSTAIDRLYQSMTTKTNK